MFGEFGMHTSSLATIYGTETKILAFQTTKYLILYIARSPGRTSWIFFKKKKTSQEMAHVKGNHVFDTGMILAPEQESLRRTLRNIKGRKEGRSLGSTHPTRFRKLK